jgi:hypothetical protein
MRACFSRRDCARAAMSQRKARLTSCVKPDLREILTLETGSKATFFQARGPREGMTAAPHDFDVGTSWGGTIRK